MKKAQHLYTLDPEQKSGNYVMEGGQYGETLHNLLLDDKKVTERDKVCIINIEIRAILMKLNKTEITKIRKNRLCLLFF